MRTASVHPSGPFRHPLRMKELVEATGAPKSTILYYLSQGLLPEPTKTSRNMAYYDVRCVDRVRFIRHLQRHHRLSLSEIRQFIETRGEDTDLTTRLELNELIFGPPDKNGLLDDGSFCDATGLTADQALELLDARLLLPLEAGRFDHEDVSIGRMFARAFAWGLRVKNLTYYVKLGEKIVDHEIALRGRATRDLPDSEDAALTLEMVKNARLSRAYIIDRLFQHRVAGIKDIKDRKDRSQ